MTNNQASVNVSPAANPHATTEEAARKQREKELDRLERQQQLPAIADTFALRTSRERAHRLAYLCYESTVGTPFKPIDLAEIALAETGGHALSARAVSSRGAVGVWQLMPERVKSHGYTPAEMKNDEKCAEAAVRELKVKLKVADGDLGDAKRLYCGIGRQARLYEEKIRKYRREILGRMSREPQQPVAELKTASL
ncbi:MAG TPA: transglycosylase SLT domain-containing protein [Geobacteraceae bacterium]|nr:transglycosylase SLT domain-containing protein [Geobacteraceae bacterium]